MLLFELLDDLLIDCLLFLFAKEGIVIFLEQNVILITLLFDSKEVIFFIVLFFGIEFFKHILSDSLFDVFWCLEFLNFIGPILTIFLLILLQLKFSRYALNLIIIGIMIRCVWFIIIFIVFVFAGKLTLGFLLLVFIRFLDESSFH